jgi:N-acyl-D-aspartate/D-glutamate deacylase
MLDLVIRNGTVVDGSGEAPYPADVGIRDGRIAGIGGIDEPAAREIDAEGLVVSPGFIDAHTHMDAQVMWDRIGSCSCWHGVTTVVMGNCGFTLAPVRRGEESLVVTNLERAEDISAKAMAEGITWSWESFAQYLDAVDRQPKAINYAAQVGHSALRTWAMGAKAFDGPSGEDEIAAMERELADALRAGAFGFTTSRNLNHETADGRPVASRLASWEEVRRLVGVMGSVNGGVFELADEPAANAFGSDEELEYRERLARLALETGVPIVFGVGTSRLLPHLEQVAQGGGRMYGLSHSRGISVVLSFKTRLPFDALPEWREVRAEPLARQRQLFADPAVRERLVRVANSGDYGPAIGAEPRRPVYDRMLVFDTPLPPHPTVSEVASSRGLDPVELIIDLGLASDFEQLFLQPITGRDSDDLLRVLKHPQTIMTFSDSGAHVSQIMDSSIHTHLLGYWVRDRQQISLEQAVRMVTSAPALAWGIQDRGLLREGFAADVNVFDPRTVAPEMPVVVNDLPGGGPRLLQKATGIKATIVNGDLVFDAGEHTGALPGELLRKAAG